MDTILQDIRYGFRTLLKTPGFTLIAVLSLALGIGANTAIFSLINALMLKQLPVRDPESLVLIGNGRAVGIFGGVPDGGVRLVSELALAEIRKDKSVLQDATGVFSLPWTYHAAIGGATASEPVKARMVTGNYFTFLGVQPAAGRLFTDAVDQPPNAHPDVVISYTWWKRRFNSSPSVVGQKLRIGQNLFTIVGVAAPEFFGTYVGESVDAWFPLSMSQRLPPFFDFHNDKLAASLHVMGRLQSGMPASQAAAGLTLLTRRFLREALGSTPSPTELLRLKKAHVDLTPAAAGLSEIRNQFSGSLIVLMAVVGIVLLIACANVANLLLARATARRREMAIRFAIGSGRGRAIRQMLTESMLLASAGGLLGILFAMWGSQILLSLVSTGPDPVALNVEPDPLVLGFTLAVSLLTGIVFGMAPAIRASSVNLNSGLREGARGAVGRTHSFAGRAIVVWQVALSLLLLIGAGLFIRSFRNLENIDTGFNRENVLRFSLDTDSAGIPEQRLPGVYQGIENRISALPGVECASFSLFTFHQGAWSTNTAFEGHPEVEKEQKEIRANVVGARFFEAAGIPLLSGRAFTARDTAASPKVAVINEKAARDVFGDGSPIGRRMSIGDTKDIEIVGVVKNAKYGELNEETPWMAYLPYTQRAQFLGNLIVRTRGNTASLIPRIRRAIADANGDLPVTDVVTMATAIDRSVVRQLLIAQLSTFFGALALLLAAIGLYGVLSYSVVQRTNEIGIRMALGAQRAMVLWMVLRETLLLVGLGVAIGLPLAAIASRYVESMLYGLKGGDALSVSVALAILLAIGAVAGLLPARRASQVDPMVALRYE